MIRLISLRLQLLGAILSLGAAELQGMRPPLLVKQVATLRGRIATAETDRLGCRVTA